MAVIPALHRSVECALRQGAHSRAANGLSLSERQSSYAIKSGASSGTALTVPAAARTFEPLNRYCDAGALRAGTTMTTRCGADCHS